VRYSNARDHTNKIHARERLNVATTAASKAKADWTNRLAVPGSRYILLSALATCWRDRILYLRDLRISSSQGQDEPLQQTEANTSGERSGCPEYPRDSAKSIPEGLAIP
jgi:hypothetical protein